jgi:hypothetical protein
MLLTYINAFHTKVSKGCLLVLESTMFLKDFSFFPSHATTAASARL